MSTQLTNPLAPILTKLISHHLSHFFDNFGSSHIQKISTSIRSTSNTLELSKLKFKEHILEDVFKEIDILHTLLMKASKHRIGNSANSKKFSFTFSNPPKNDSTSNLAFRIKTGYVEQLSIKIPWQLQKKSVTVKIKGVCLLLIPTTESDLRDVEAQEKRSMQWKRLNLDRWEEKYIRAQESISKEKKKSFSLLRSKKSQNDKIEGEVSEKNTSQLEGTFFERLLETIINNIHVEIENLHVRYEDEKSENNPFILGAFFRNLYVHSTDEQFAPQFTREIQDETYKRVDCSDFSIYLNHPLSEHQGEIMNSSVTETLRNSILDTQFLSRKEIFFKDYSTSKKIPIDTDIIFINEMKRLMESTKNDYILFPTLFQLKLKMQKLSKSLLKQMKPQFDADIEFFDVQCSISDRQYRTLTKLADYLTNFATYGPFRRHKPIAAIIDNPRSWWTFAIQCAKEENRHSHIYWHQIISFNRDRKRYIELYKMKQEVPWLPKLTEEEKLELDSLETRVTLNNLMFFRKLALIEIQEEQKQHSAWRKQQIRPKNLFSDKNTFFKKLLVSTPDPGIINISEEQKQELYQCIGYSEEDDTTLLRDSDASYIRMQMRLKLGDAALFFYEHGTKIKKRINIVKANFGSLFAELKVMTQSFMVTLNAQRFNLLDCQSENPSFQHIIRRCDIDAKSNLISLCFIKNPNKIVRLMKEIPNQIADYALALTVDHVNIILNVEFIRRILSFLNVDYVNYQKLEELARENIDKVTTVAKDELKKLLQDKTTVDLNIHVKSPLVIMPSHCKSIDNKPIVIDFGSFTARSRLSAIRQVSLQDGANIDPQAYELKDHYDLTFNNVCILVPRMETEDTIRCAEKNRRSKIYEQSDHLMKKVSFQVDIAQSLLPSDESIPRLFVSSQIGNIQSCVSPQTLMVAVQIADTISEFLENPTGASDSDLRLRQTLMINGPISNNQWMKVKVEVRSTRKVLLFDTSSEKLVGTIKLKSNTIIKGSKSKTRVFRLDEPVDSKTSSHFFACDSLEQRDMWIRELRRIVSSFETSFYIGSLASTILNDIKSNLKNSHIENIVGISSRNQTLFGFKFSLDNLFVTAERGRDIPLAQIQFSNLFVESVNNICETTISAGLTSIVIKNLIEESFTKTILEGTSGNDIVNFRLTYANERSPHYTKLASLLISFSIEGMKAHLDPTLLLHIIKFAQDTYHAIRLIDFKRNIYQELKRAIIQPGSRENILKVDFKTGAMGLHLNKFNDEVIEITAPGFSSCFLLNTIRLQFEGCLEDVLVKDMLALETKYRTIFGLGSKESGSMVSFKYIQSFSEASGIDYRKSFSATLKQIQYIHLQNVFRNIRNYIFDELQESAQHIFKENEIPQSGSPILLQTLGSLTKICIEVSNPIILVPVSILSGNYLSANLGHISVTNSLVRTNNSFEEVYMITLHNVNMKMILDSSSQKIVHNGTIGIELRRLLSNKLDPTLPRFKINIDTSDLVLEVNHSQYQALFDVLNHNIREGLESVERELQFFRVFETLSQKLSNMSIPKSQSRLDIDLQSNCTPSEYDSYIEPFNREYESPTYSNLDVELNLSSVTFTLRRKNDPIITFLVNKAHAFYSLKSDNTSIGEISVGNLVGSNSKIESDDGNMHVFKFGASTESSTCIYLSYEKMEGIHNIQLNFSDPTIVLIPEVLQELVIFVTKTKYIQSIESQTEDLNTSQEITADMLSLFSSPLKISANFGRTSIVLLEDYSCKSSRRLVLAFSAECYFEKDENIERGVYSIKDLHSFINCNDKNLFIEKESALLVQPIDIITNLSTSAIDSEVTKRNISVSIEKGGTSRVSYQDLRMIVHVVSQFSQREITNIDTFDETIEEGMILKKWISENLRNSPLSLQLASRAHVKFSFLSKNPLQILVVDDMTGFDIPLFSFTISKLKMTGSLVLGEPPVTTLMANAEIGTLFDAKYYNYSVAEWEPVIEETQKPLYITYSHGPSNANPSHSEDAFSITLDDTFNINVTHSMVATVMKTWKLWLEGLRNPSSQISTRFEPYSIRNYSGLNVRFYIPGVETEECARPITSEEYGFSFPSGAREGELASRIVLLIEGKEKSLHVNKAKDQFVKYREKGNQESNTEHYFCCVNVAVHNGRKVITINSGVFIENRTRTNWKIGVSSIHDDSENSIIEIGKLLPDKKFFIPVQYLVPDYTIAYKPEFEDQQDIYSWSNVDHSKSITYLLFNGNRKVLFSCKKIDETFGHTGYHCVQNITVKMERNIQLITRITLIPPICIDNLLSSCLKVQLFTRKGNQAVQLYSTNILAGESEFIHAVNLKQNIWLRPILIGEWKACSAGLIYDVSKDSTNLETTFQNEYLPNKKKLLIKGEYIFDHETAFQHLSIYCPYWIVNHTKKSIEVRVGDEPVAGQLELFEPLMFNYTTSNFVFSNMINIKVGSMFQSDDFSIDTPGTYGNLKLTNGTVRYELGVNVEMGQGQFHRTKVVTLTPRYMLVNRTGSFVYFREFGTDHEIQVEAGGSEPFYNISSKQTEFPVISVRTENSNWTGALKITSNRDFNPILWNSKDQKHEFTSIQVYQQKSIIYIVFELMDTPPFVIENHSKFVIQVAQRGTSTWTILEKGDSVPYSWTDQNGSHLLNIRCSQYLSCINLDNMQAETKLKVHDEIAHIKLYTNGRDRKLLISEESHDVIPETNDLNSLEEVLFQINVNFDGLGFSLIDQNPQELVYAYIQDVQFLFLMSNVRQYIDIKAKKIQVNNQLPDTLYPITFVNSKKLAEDEMFFNATLVRLHKVKDYYSFPFFSLHLHEFDLALDLNFLSRLSRFFSTLDGSNLKTTQLSSNGSILNTDTLVDNLNWLRVLSTNIQESKRTYFQKLQIYPLLFNLTLLVNQRQDESTTKRSSVIALLEAIGAQFNVNLEDYPIRMQALYLQHPFMTRKELVERVSKHYQQQAVVEVYKAIGSFDFLGNPIGLFQDIDTAVYDLIYEPLEALRRDPRDITKGLARGSVSFFKHSIHGTFNSASKVTESIGNGLSYLTLDSDFISSRHKQHRKENPRHVGEGLIYGFQSLGTGVYDGITGLVTKPIEGANEGVAGFFSGVGKGIAGMPVKPVTALLDFASKTTKGIRNTTTFFDKEPRERTRLPRVFGLDGKLVPYDTMNSQTQFVLHQVSRGKYADDHYICHAVLKDTMGILILSDKRVVFVLNGHRTEEWIVLLEEIEDMRIISQQNLRQKEYIIDFNELGRKNHSGGWLIRASSSKRLPIRTGTEDEVEISNFIQMFHLLRSSSETHDIE